MDETRQGRSDGQRESRLRAELGEGRRQVADIPGLGQPDGEAGKKHHRGQRDHEGRHPQFGHSEAIARADQPTQAEHQQDCHRGGQWASCEPAGLAVHGQRPDDRGERDDGGHGQVDSADDEDERLSEGHHQQRGHVVEQAQEVARGGEPGREGGKAGEQPDTKEQHQVGGPERRRKARRPSPGTGGGAAVHFRFTFAPHICAAFSLALP